MSRINDILREVARSYRWGLRDALRPRLAFASLVVAAVAVVMMSVVFSVWHEPIKDWCGIWGGWALRRLWAAPGDLWGTVLTWLLMISIYVLGVMLLMQLMLELWLMQRIQSVCLHRHPALQGRERDGGFRQALLSFTSVLLTWVVGGLLCLLVPVMGGVLLVALSSYLGVRSLVNDSLQGLASDAELRTLTRSSRPEMLALGLLIALTAFIPLVGFLAPALAGASTCHLMMARLERLTSPHGA